LAKAGDRITTPPKFSEQIKEWYGMFGIEYILPYSTSSQPDYSKGPELSKGIGTLEELRKAVSEIECPLRSAAKNTVFSDGDPGSGIMFIGEAPGKEEDEQGKPFVGQSGQLLNEMLRAVGLKRLEVYITNIVFWRPPGNRTPSSDEVGLCLPYVRKHIEIVKPRVIVLLGSVAIQAILETRSSVATIRGRHWAVSGIPVIATYHPAYLLRSPSQKSLAFQDFIQIVRKLKPI
jgi:DNA polymerase